MPIDIPITFINEQQTNYFNSPKRNKLACGGYGSGKTYVICEQAMLLLTSFNKYRVTIGRQTFRDLKRTTTSTFFKLCPPELYAPPFGRYSENEGYLRLINGSEVMFMHLDEVDEQSLRGLETNSIFIDQAEEISESLYYTLDARVGRWDQARPAKHLDTGKWPLNHIGKPKIPNYFWLSCNPEDETHFLWRLFHPDSLESKQWADVYHYEEFPSDKNPCLDPETLRVMLSRDPSWVKRFVYGKWGISEATIHKILPESIIQVSDDFLKTIIRHGALYRVLDHGDAAPTCCLWFSAYKGWHFLYREYYKPGALIAEHRKSIAMLSEDERYRADYADPSIFKMASQKAGGFWSVAQEYSDESIDAPPIYFEPADNNELATRNRINEMLALNPNVKHPITGESPAPQIYFVTNYGVPNALMETRNQRRLKLGEINGKPIFSDERDDKLVDHAYDPFRYYVAMHALSLRDKVRAEIPPKSFAAARNRLKLLQHTGSFGRFRHN